jgi:ribosomal protein L23
MKKKLSDTGSKKEWSDSKEFKEYAEHILKEMVPAMKDSAVVMTIAPDAGQHDIKIAVEIGYSILLDKPLIVIASPGRHIAERLLRIADHVITGDITTDAGKEEIARALKHLMNQ